MKEKLQLAPNNPSAWNYLRGCVSVSVRPSSPPLTLYTHSLLKVTSTPLASFASFAAPFAVPPPSVPSDASSTSTTSDSDADDKPSLPAFLAIEFLADACAEEAAKGKVAEKGLEAAAVSLCSGELGEWG